MKVAELTATLDEIANPSYQADPVAPSPRRPVAAGDMLSLVAPETIRWAHSMSGGTVTFKSARMPVLTLRIRPEPKGL